MQTKNLIILSLFTAISIVLTRFFSVMLPITGIAGIRLSFGDIPILLSGILFGPLAGALVGITADIIGAVFLSTFGYFPGFTISAALTGVIPPLAIKIFGTRKIKVKHIFLSILMTDIVVSLCLNTLWLNVMTGKAFFVLLPPRIIARIILIPIATAVVYALYKKIKNLNLI
ncbi:folate family ECF transporter S component [Clostridiaceae bacterium 35-E11]